MTKPIEVFKPEDFEDQKEFDAPKFIGTRRAAEIANAKFRCFEGGEHQAYIAYHPGADGVYAKFAKCEKCGLKLKAAWWVES